VPPTAHDMSTPATTAAAAMALSTPSPPPLPHLAGRHPVRAEDGDLVARSITRTARC
jgi:hypothetical protein